MSATMDQESTGIWRFAGTALQPILKVADKACRSLKAKRQEPYLPIKPEDVPPTPTAEINDALEHLRTRKDVWQWVMCGDRAKLLQQCLDNLPSVARKAAHEATLAHGSYGTGIGEEYSFWIPIALALMEYKVAMESNGQPPPYRLRKRKGQWIADIFPRGMLSALFGSTRAEVWIQMNKKPSQGSSYRIKNRLDFEPDGQISLVLGAGNHINVVVLDILHKLICDDDVVIVKMNPINAFLAKYVEEALAPFFERGFVKIVFGNAKEGVYLGDHGLVDDIHLTGSMKTFNRVVFGTSSVNKGTFPVKQKKVTGELGCFTPAIIIPGEWTESDMEYVATTIVAGLASNSGHSCCGLECIIMLEKWSLRERFIEVLTRKLDEKERQVAWYPGSREKYDKFLRRCPDAVKLGRATLNEEETLPWLLAKRRSPKYARTKSETWCGVLQEIILPGEQDSPARFMREVAEYCNQNCWGTLSCTVIIDPKTQSKHETSFDNMIADLRYGTIVVNAPPIFGFLPAGTWGAFPGNPISDIGSGNCFVHNTSLFDYPEKTVWYCPWRLHPVPLWADITNKDAVIEALLHLIKSPGLLNMFKVVIPILRASTD